jgi:hypothetical protein
MGAARVLAAPPHPARFLAPFRLRPRSLPLSMSIAAHSPTPIRQRLALTDPELFTSSHPPAICQNKARPS